jgi:hypothetical protein
MGRKQPKAVIQICLANRGRFTFESQSTEVMMTRKQYLCSIRMAFLLSFRKLALVRKSGIKHPASHVGSTLRWVFRSRRRLN